MGLVRLGAEFLLNAVHSFRTDLTHLLESDHLSRSTVAGLVDLSPTTTRGQLRLGARADDLRLRSGQSLGES
jgi:hypothetical protein